MSTKWVWKSNSSQAEIKVAEKYLLAYDLSEVTAKANGNIPNQGVLAQGYFTESLNDHEASLPFTRMLLMYGPVLHWNDSADTCFWVLGFNPNTSWAEWKKYKEEKGI